MRPTVKPIGCYPFSPEVVHISGYQLRGLLVEGDTSATSSGDRCPLDRFVASTQFGNSADERDWGELVEVRVRSTSDKCLTHYDTGLWIVRLHQGLSQLFAVDNTERGLDDNDDSEYYLQTLIRSVTAPTPPPPPHTHSIPPFLCQSVELPLTGFLAPSPSLTFEEEVSKTTIGVAPGTWLKLYSLIVVLDGPLVFAQFTVSKPTVAIQFVPVRVKLYGLV